MKKKEKIKLLLKESYLAVIKNSSGSKIFRNFYAKVKEKKKDILNNGELSCSFFVSSILVIFKLIKEIHFTVSGSIRDLEKSGWRKIEVDSQIKKRIKPGNIILWEEKKIDQEVHKHIGFYLGRKKAISNAYWLYKKREPIIHHFTYHGKRKIVAIYWHKKLEI